MFGMNFFDMGGPGAPRPFKNQYRCYSVSMLPDSEHRNESLEHGGKIIMPPSALDQLTRLNIVYPMLFKLTNTTSGRTTHCGVLEFVAGEGKIYIPYWMMQNLTCEEGGFIQVESASLPVATFAKFQPHSTDFLDMTNPKAVLEARLRNFACLSKDDVIAIQYNDKVYEMSVLETKPANAVSVIECDLNVDFAPPVGYQEPTRPVAGTSSSTSVGGGSSGGRGPEGARAGCGGSSTPGNAIGAGGSLDMQPEMDVSELLPEQTGFIPFVGSGNRLDGKKSRVSDQMVERPKQEYVRGIPDYYFQVGTLNFIRSRAPAAVANGGKEDDKKESNFTAFQGQGKSLRQAKSSGRK